MDRSTACEDQRFNFDLTFVLLPFAISIVFVLPHLHSMPVFKYLLVWESTIEGIRCSHLHHMVNGLLLEFRGEGDVTPMDGAIDVHSDVHPAFTIAWGSQSHSHVC